MNACTTSSHARFEGIILPDPRPTSDAADNASKFAETTAKTTCNAAMPLQRFCTHPHNPPTHTTPFVESYYLAALTAPIMGTKPRSLLGGGRFIIMIYIISLTLLLQQPTFLATLREQWATNPRPTPQRRWEPETEALRTGTAWSHVFETKKHWPGALPGARFKCTKPFEADDFRSHLATPRGPQPHSRGGGTTPASPAGEHTTAPARALTSVPRYYFAFFARPRRHTSKKARTAGGPALQTVGMAPNSTNTCPGHALKKTLRPNLSPRSRGIETSASNMVKHGQTWSNMVIHAPRTAGGPALQTVGMAPNSTNACPGHALKKTLRPNLSPRLRGIETSASNMVKHGQTWSNMVIHAPRTAGGPALQTVGMAPNSTNTCPGHALKKTLRPNLSPRLRGIETSASNMVKHGQTWSNMVIPDAPRTAGGPALQTVGMDPNSTYACHGSISRFERPPGADLLEFEVVVDLLDSDDDTPIGFKESLRLRDLSSPAPFHKTGAKKGGDNPQAGCSTDPQPGEAPS